MEDKKKKTRKPKEGNRVPGPLGPLGPKDPSPLWNTTGKSIPVPRIGS